VNIDWLSAPAAALDEGVRREAIDRQAQLTKPPGSLGRLEEVALRLAAVQGRARPAVDRVRIAVFAADHGVAARGVSAFPQSVTAEMVRNFARGGAAISVLARELGARLEVIDLGTLSGTSEVTGVVDSWLGPGTADFSITAAMTEQQLASALDAGRRAVLGAVEDEDELFIGGEMGIGNTTAATAVACALLGADPAALAGPGTGLDSAGIARKASVVREALATHGDNIDEPLEVLRRLGGFEIAALTGAFVACGQHGLPAVVDGFIAGVSALAATRLCSGLEERLLFSHVSAEPGHARIVAALGADPLLDLGMRLGEASGAAVALPLLRLACSLHNDMATFDEAGVSEKT
jgi:nicotinate-nucleotide--dimethylbenzimidazole phosphoribosyltransferase